MVLAINNVGGGNVAKEASYHNIQAANFYAFYQSKSIKQHETQLARDAVIREISKLQDETGKKITGPLSPYGYYLGDLIQYEKDLARYESDPVSGEGKKELLVKAKEHELERDHALKQDPWFDYGEDILQIAIVLLSISIISSMPLLAIIGTVLGVLGALCMANGFFLLI